MNRPAFSYRFGAAEFDESRFELRVAGLPVEVERRALEVLVVLLRHAGEVVTKEELLGEVWAGRITVDKVLPNAINKLRRALGEANAVHISTQARLGYRLDGTVTRTAVGRQVASELALVACAPRQDARAADLQICLGQRPPACT
jgi:eukaryotic-like serine/threonine-protein kinase